MYISGVGVLRMADTPSGNLTRAAFSGEASAGECAGRSVNRDRPIMPGADIVLNVEGRKPGAPLRAPGRSFWYGNREVPRRAGSARNARWSGPHRESEEPKRMMHDREKSDSAIVATKPTNKAGQPAAEPRAGTTIASVNDAPIKFHWPLGRRPDDHPSRSRPVALSRHD